jgi:hypothetical protein
MGVKQPGDQIDSRPTRKLTAASAASGVTIAILAGPAFAEVLRGFLAGTPFGGPAFAALTGYAATALVGAAITLGSGYWVRDRPNTPGDGR